MTNRTVGPTLRLINVKIIGERSNLDLQKIRRENYRLLRLSRTRPELYYHVTLRHHFARIGLPSVGALHRGDDSRSTSGSVLHGSSARNTLLLSVIMANEIAVNVVAVQRGEKRGLRESSCGPQESRCDSSYPGALPTA